jgi:hypothetical protein
MFAKYEVLKSFSLEGINDPFEIGSTIILPVTFGDDLVEKGAIKKL